MDRCIPAPPALCERPSGNFESKFRLNSRARQRKKHAALPAPCYIEEATAAAAPPGSDLRIRMFKQARNLALPFVFIFFAGWSLALAQSAVPSGSTAKTVTGTVFYRQRIALPNDAVVQLVIEDVSYPDAPPVSVAEEAIATSGKQVPIAFAVRYDPSVLIPSHHYQIRASITAHDQLLFASTTAYPVLAPGAPANVNIRVDQVAGNPSVAASKPDRPLIGIHWRLADLNGKPVTLSMEQRPNFVLTDDGNRITGSGGCNRLMGSYELDGNSLRFKTVATTMMACLGPVMDVERKFLAVLNATTAYRISGATLQLLDDKGHALAWLHAVSDE
jgi:putative lipoprotein